jgi:hypothetical protein
VGLDGLRGPWAASVLLNMRESYFMSQGIMNNGGKSDTADKTSSARDLFSRQVPGRRTAVLVDLEPNHDRQNCGGLVRAQVGPPQGFLSTHPVAKAEVDAVRYSLCLPGRISHSVYHPKCLRLNCFHF